MTPKSTPWSQNYDNASKSMSSRTNSTSSHKKVRHVLQSYIMTSKVCHDVKKYIKTSKLHYDVKGVSKSMSWRQKYVMTSKYVTPKRRHEIEKFVKHVMTAKTRYDYKQFAMTPKNTYWIQNYVNVSKNMSSHQKVRQKVRHVRHQKFVMMFKSISRRHIYIMTSKVCQNVRHEKFVMTSKTRHNVKKLVKHGMTSKMCHDIKNTSWRRKNSKKYIMKSKSSSWRPKHVQNTSRRQTICKTRHDVTKFVNKAIWSPKISRQQVQKLTSLTSLSHPDIYAPI